MTGKCRVCERDIDDQDIQNAGMDNICWGCCIAEDEERSKSEIMREITQIE